MSGKILTCGVLLLLTMANFFVCEPIPSETENAAVRMIGGHIDTTEEESDQRDGKRTLVDLLKGSYFDKSSDSDANEDELTGRGIIDVREGLRSVSYIIHPDNLSNEKLRPDWEKSISKSQSTFEEGEMNETVTQSQLSSSTLKTPTTYYSFANSDIKPMEPFSLIAHPSVVSPFNDPKIAAKINSIAQSMLTSSNPEANNELPEPTTPAFPSSTLDDKNIRDIVTTDSFPQLNVFSEKEVIDRIRKFLSKEKYSDALKSKASQIKVATSLLKYDNQSINESIQVSNHTPRYEDSDSTNFVDDIKSFLSDLANSNGFKNVFLADLVKNFGSLDRNGLMLIYNLLVKPLAETLINDALQDDEPSYPIASESSRVWKPSELIERGPNGEEAWRPYLRRPKSPDMFHSADTNVAVITAPTPGKFQVLLGSSFLPGSNLAVAQSRAGLPMSSTRQKMFAVPPPEALNALPPGSVLIDPSQILGNRGPPKVKPKNDDYGTFASLLSNLPSFFGSTNNRDSVRKPRLPSFLSAIFGSPKKSTQRPSYPYQNVRSRLPVNPPPPVYKDIGDRMDVNMQPPPVLRNPDRYSPVRYFHGSGDRRNNMPLLREEIVSPYSKMTSGSFDMDSSPSVNIEDHNYYSGPSVNQDRDYYSGPSPSIMFNHFYSDDEDKESVQYPELEKLWDSNYNAYTNRNNVSINLVRATNPDRNNEEPKQYVYPFEHSEQYNNRRREQSNAFDDYANTNDDYNDNVQQRRPIETPQINNYDSNVKADFNDGDTDLSDTDDADNYYYYYDSQESEIQQPNVSERVIEDSYYEGSNPRLDIADYPDYTNGDQLSDYENYHYSDTDQDDSHTEGDEIKLRNDVFIQSSTTMSSVDTIYQDESKGKYDVPNVLDQIKKDAEAILYSNIGPVDIPEGTLIPKDDFQKALHDLKYKHKFVRVNHNVGQGPSLSTTTEEAPKRKLTKKQLPSLSDEHDAAVAHLWNNIKLTLQTERPPSIKTEITDAPSTNYTKPVVAEERYNRSTMAYILIAVCSGLAIFSIVGIILIIRLKKSCASGHIGDDLGRSHYNKRSSLGDLPHFKSDDDKPGHKLGSWFTGRNEQMGTGKLRSNMTLPDVKKTGSARDLLSLSSSSSSRGSSQRSEKLDESLDKSQLKHFPIEGGQPSSSSWLHETFEASHRKEQIRKSNSKISSTKDGIPKSSYHYYGDSDFGATRHGGGGGFESDDTASRYRTDSEFDDTSYGPADSRDLAHLLKTKNQIRSMDSEELGDELSRDLRHFQRKDDDDDDGHYSETTDHDSSSRNALDSRDNIQNEVFLEFDNMLRQHTHVSTLSGIKSSDGSESPPPPPTDSSSPSVAPPRPPKPNRLSPDSPSRGVRARAPTPTNDDGHSSDDGRLI